MKTEEKRNERRETKEVKIFISEFFNGAVSSADYVYSVELEDDEQLFPKDVEGSGRG
jgi:hypothetical protein